MNQQQAQPVALTPETTMHFKRIVDILSTQPLLLNDQGRNARDESMNFILLVLQDHISIVVERDALQNTVNMNKGFIEKLQGEIEQNNTELEAYDKRVKQLKKTAATKRAKEQNKE